MSNPNTLWPISPLYTGMVAAAGRPPALVGRSSMTRVRVESKDFKGKILVDNARDLRAANLGDIRSEPGGRFKQVDAGDVSTVDYTVERLGVQTKDVPFEHDTRDQTKAVRPTLSRRARQMMKALRTVQNMDEKRIADFYGSTANWTFNSTCVGIAGGAGKQWSDPTSRPLQDMKALRKTYYERNGVFPRKVRTSWQVINALSTHPDFLTSTINAGGSIVTRPFVGDADVVALIAQVFSIPVANVVVGPGLADTANPGASESLGYLWGDFFWIGCDDGADAATDGADVETSLTACIGIDEVGIPEAVVPGISQISADLFLGGEYADTDLMVWRGRVFHYSTEVVLVASLGQLTTDCIA